MKNKNLFLQSVFLTLVLLLTGVGNLWATDYGTDKVVFKSGETIYYDLTGYGSNANIYNAAGNEYGTYTGHIGGVSSIIAVELTSDLTITTSSNLFKSVASNWGGVTAALPTDGQNMIVSTDGKTASWGTYVAPTPHTIYFQNTPNWSSVYVNFYKSAYWDAANGSGSSNIASAGNAMTLVSGSGTSAIYSYEYTGDYSIVCFTKDQQSGYGNFWKTEAAYKTNYSTSTPLYVPSTSASDTIWRKGSTAEQHTTYYNVGTWSAYPPASGHTITYDPATAGTGWTYNSAPTSVSVAKKTTASTTWYFACSNKTSSDAFTAHPTESNSYYSTKFTSGGDYDYFYFSDGSKAYKCTTSGNTTPKTDGTTYDISTSGTGFFHGVSNVYAVINASTKKVYFTTTAPGTTTHTVTYNPSSASAGWTYTSAPTSVEDGKTLTMVITPTEGYNVTVKNGDNALTPDADGKTYTIENVTADLTINVSATKQSISITYPAESTGWSYGSTKPETVEYGADLSFQVVPATGYTVTVKNGETTLTAGDNNTYTISAVKAAPSITISAAEITFAVTVAKGTGVASVSPTSVTVGQITASSEITATASTGYTLSGWTLGDGITIASGTTSPITIKATKAGTITATATEVMSTITVSSANTDQGSVSAETASVGIASTATLTATAKTGYKFKSWELTGCALSSGALTDASITIIGLGAGAAGSAVANFEEDLSCDWKLHIWVGPGNDDWGTYDFAKESGHSAESVAYYTLALNAGEHDMELQNGSYYKNKGTFKSTDANWEYTTSETTRGKIFCNVTGNYTFKIDYSGSNPKLVSVTYPSFYTVTFKNGDANFAEQYVIPEQSIGSFPTAPTKDGYTFLGWYDAATGGNAVTTSFTPTMATTLYAHFAKIEVASKVGDVAKTQVLKETVTIVPTATGLAAETPVYTYSYSKDGGEAVAMSGNTLNISEAGTYVFTVSATENGVTVSGTCTVTCVIPGHLVYATSEGDWKAIKAVEAESENVVKATVDGSVLRRRTDGDYVGRSYFGFSTLSSVDGTYKDCFGSTTSADAEVMVDGAAVASQYQASKALYITLDADTKANYDFTFHFNITNGEVSVTKEIKSVTVTYALDGGTISEGSGTKTVKAGEGYALPYAYKEDGDTYYVFKGWKNGSTTYEAGATFSTSSDVTLTAQWGEKLKEIIPGDQIVFLSATQATKVYMWGDSKTAVTKDLTSPDPGLYDSKYLTYYNNSSDKYEKAIAYKGSEVKDDNKLTLDITKANQDYPNNILYYVVGEKKNDNFATFTRLTTSGAPTLSATDVAIGAEVTVNMDAVSVSTGTLKDGATYNFYAQLNGGSYQYYATSQSGSWTFTPNVAGTYTFVIQAQDPYGFERIAIDNSLSLTVSDPSLRAHDVAFTVAEGGSVKVDGADVENGGSASISEVQASTLVASSATHYFNGWTLGSGVTLQDDYALTDKTIQVMTASTGDYTVSADFVAYAPVASISVSPTYVVPGSSTEVTLTPTSGTSWPADMTYVWELYKGDDLVSTTDDYFTITDGAETAKLAAAKVAALEAGVYTFKLKVYAGDQCSENQLGETKTCTFSVATPYYVYQGQNYSLPTGYTYSISTDDSNPAYYAYDNGTLQYTSSNEISGTNFVANTMGMYIVEKTQLSGDAAYTDNLTPEIIYVYRYYAKFPWGYCGSDGKEGNIAWKWEPLKCENATNKKFTITGLYSTTSSNNANIGWDYYYDWSGVYRYDGLGNSNTHPGLDEGSHAGIWQESYDAASKKLNENTDAAEHGASKYMGITISGETPACGGWFKLDYTAKNPTNGTTVPDVQSGGSYSGVKTTDPYPFTLTYGACTGYNYGTVSHDQPANKVADGTVVTFNAAATTSGYFCTGWYSDAACTTPIEASEDVIINENTLIATIHSDFSAYAKFTKYRLLYGDFDGDGTWENYAMKDIGNNEFQVALKLQGSKTYEFKIRYGSADTYYGCDNLTILRKDNSNPDKTLVSGQANVKLNADLDSTYTFTWKDTGTKLAVTFPTGNLLYVWKGASGTEQYAKKNFYTTSKCGETTVTFDEDDLGIYRFKMQDYQDSNEPSEDKNWYGMDGKDSESGAIQHTVYNWTMYSLKKDVFFNVNQAGTYHFYLEWKNNTPYISVVYPSKSSDYDVSGVLAGTHKVILFGMPQDWSQVRYYLFDSEGNEVYSTPMSQKLTVNGVVYRVGAIPVATSDIKAAETEESAEGVVKFYHGHTKDLGLQHSVTDGGIYIVTTQFASGSVPEGFTELTTHVNGSVTDALYRYVPTYTAHTEVTSTVKSATTLGVSATQSTTCTEKGQSILGTANNFKYFVKDQNGDWNPASVSGGKLDLTDQTSYPTYRGYELATVLYDGYVYERPVANNLFDIVDIALTDDNNNTSCYTTFYNSQKSVVVPTGLKATVIAYNESTNALYRSHTFKAGDVIPAGTAVVFQGNYTFMQSAQVENNDRSKGNRILETGTPANDEFASNLVGTDDSGEMVAQIGTNVVKAYKFSRNSAGTAGSLGWYWGNNAGTGEFEAWPHKAYLVLHSTSVPVRFVMSDILDANPAPTALDENLDNNAVQKLLLNGNVYILRSGCLYDLNGRLIEKK